MEEAGSKWNSELGAWSLQERLLGAGILTPQEVESAAGTGFQRGLHEFGSGCGTTTI